MPRPLRIEIHDGWYHVMNRGVSHKNIFKNDKHRLTFLDLLGEAASLFQIKIHSYCLMDNHYHLLIHTPQGNLSRAMRHINGIYTQRFNRMEKREGSLFRGRYKAILIDKDSYLTQVSRYIHLNPVAAKLCSKPDMYKWSSCQYYCKNKDNPSWLITKDTLLMMTGRKKKKAYKAFLQNGVNKEISKFYKKNHTSTILGDKLFREKYLDELQEEQIDAAKADYNRTRERPLMDTINTVCAKYFKISKDDLYKNSRGRVNYYRQIGMYACRQWSCETLQGIAKQYGCKSYANVGYAVNCVRKRLVNDYKLRKTIKELEKTVFLRWYGKYCQFDT